LNSRFASKLSRRQLLKILLGLVSAGFFVVTALMLYRQIEQEQAFRVNFRTSGWAAYQAEREYGRAVGALKIASMMPSADNIQDARLRLDLFASRLPILREGTEGRFLRELLDLDAMLKPVERDIDWAIAELDQIDAGRMDAALRVRLIHDRFGAYGPAFQNLVQTAVVYNERFYQLEERYRNSAPFLPLILLFLSGGGLVLLLGLEVRRSRRRLEQTQEARRAMQASETSLRNLIEAAPVGIMIYDSEHDTIEYVNPAAAVLLPPETAGGSGDWWRLVRAVRNQAEEAARQDSAKISLQRRGDVLSLQVAERSIQWNGRKCQMFVFMDLTPLQIAERQVLQASQLSQLGEMAASIAHEINQPLTVISLTAANSKLMLQRPDLPPSDVIAKLDRIEAQVARARRITDQMRRYGRAPVAGSERFNVQAAIDLAVGFMQDQFRVAGLRMSMDNSLEGEVMVAGDQIMFEQVIVNLLANARDASEDARAAGRLAQDDRPDVVVRLARRSGSIVVEVEDRGGGIPAEAMAKIFKPLYTSKPAGKGTGLGLAYCRNVLNAMNGTITARNGPEGALFTVSLPSVDEESPGDAQAVSAA
jgi:signal transduction histidine kinase